MNLARSTPPAEPPPKAKMPRAMISRVWSFRKLAAVAVAPTEMPRKMVTMLMSSFWAVLLRRSVTPLSLNRLPSIRQPTRGAASGTRKLTKMVTAMGKMIFSVWDTARSCFMVICRSALVVRARMMGGWMTGTRAM